MRETKRNYFPSLAPPRNAILSRGGPPCVKAKMVVSDGKHDLHMLTASCPAGSALPMVGVSYQRSGWEWPRCLGAEAEGHLGAFEQVRMRMKSETSESSSTLPGGPGVVLWSLVKVVKREDVIVDQYDLSGSSLTVTLTETLGPQLVVYVEQCSI